MSGFDTRWLDLREPADHAARDASLLDAARTHLLAGGGSPLAVDLGSGTGSTVRAFGPTCGAVRWRLVDHDPRLLDAAGARLEGFEAVDHLEADLDALSPAALSGARLVTASALFDLVSRAVLDRLAALISAEGIGLYAALNYDGTTRWTPALPADDRILTAFNSHQKGDKGLGPALGPEAAAALRDAFEAMGYVVRIAASPWRLGPAEAALNDALLDGFVGAVAETGRIEAAEMKEWSRRRRAQRGECHVGHWDVLALPASR